MDARLVQTVNQHIYQRFPELKGVLPRVQTLRSGQGRNVRVRPSLRWLDRLRPPRPLPDMFLLVYHGQRATPGGGVAPLVVRVVVEAGGKILKTTLSHAL